MTRPDQVAADTAPLGAERPPPEPLEPLDYQPPQDRPGRRWGTGFLPAVASLYLPGLGHLFAGRRRAAAGWLGAYVALALLMFAAMGLPTLTPGLILLAPAALGLAIACAVHAFRAGVKSDRPMLGHAALRYLAGAGLLLAAAFSIHPMA